MLGYFRYVSKSLGGQNLWGGEGGQKLWGFKLLVVNNFGRFKLMGVKKFEDVKIFEGVKNFGGSKFLRWSTFLEWWKFLCG